jgi:hypothetical protein
VPTVDKLELELELETLTKVSYEETISLCKKLFPCDKNSGRAAVSRAAQYVFCSLLQVEKLWVGITGNDFRWKAANQSKD